MSALDDCVREVARRKERLVALIGARPPTRSRMIERTRTALEAAETAPEHGDFLEVYRVMEELGALGRQARFAPEGDW